jgi:hypothetical protein
MLPPLKPGTLVRIIIDPISETVHYGDIGIIVKQSYYNTTDLIGEQSPRLPPTTLLYQVLINEKQYMIHQSAFEVIKE